MSDESLGSILSNDEAPEETQTETVEVEPEAKATSETQAAEPVATESETDEIDAADDDLGDLRYSGLKKAARKERKFRQEAEKKAKELQRHIEQLSAQMQAQVRQQPPQHVQPPTEAKKEDEPDFFADPEGFATRKAEAAAQKVRDELTRRFEQQTRLSMSRMRLLQQHEDGEQMLVAFRDMAQRDPRLEQMVLAADDPAGYAYSYAKEALRIAQYNSIDELIAAERTKWEAEQRGEPEAPAVPAKPHHKTIAAARGSGGSTRRASEDPDSLSAILS